MFEEEIRAGEQEREGLRIENQRIRDELSDLKIEAEIVQEKLRFAEEEVKKLHDQRIASITARPTSSDGEVVRPRTAGSEASTVPTTLSSPTASTPPMRKPEISPVMGTPPSPPLSDSASAKPITSMGPITPILNKKRSTTLSSLKKTTPRSATTTSTMPSYSTATIRSKARHGRGPSVPTVTTTTPTSRRPTGVPQSAHKSRPSISTLPTPSRPSMPPPAPAGAEPLPRSGSLYHIRGLMTKMSKLEARVHNARSKLPAPTVTPPRASPRQASGSYHHSATPSLNGAPGIPGNVTVRRSGRDRRSRVSNSTATSTDYNSSRPVSRLSFGITSAAQQEREKDAPRPTSALSSGRPPSATGHRPPSVTGHRPTSSHSHYTQPTASSMQFVRPSSRTSTRTPLGNYPPVNNQRPPSRSGVRGSISANFSSSVSGTHPYGHGHGHSASVSSIATDDTFSTPRRSTFGKSAETLVGVSGIPTPRRKSGGASAMLGLPDGRRQSAGGSGPGSANGSFGSDGGGGGGEMGPPPNVNASMESLSEVGETY